MARARRACKLSSAYGMGLARRAGLRPWLPGAWRGHPARQQVSDARQARGVCAVDRTTPAVGARVGHGVALDRRACSRRRDTVVAAVSEMFDAARQLQRAIWRAQGKLARIPLDVRPKLGVGICALKLRLVPVRRRPRAPRAICRRLSVRLRERESTASATAPTTPATISGSAPACRAARKPIAFTG